MLLFQVCFNIAAYVREIRITDGIMYPLILSLYSHWQYDIPMLKVLCDSERRCDTYLRNISGGRATVCVHMLCSLYKTVRPCRSQNGTGF